MNIFRGKVKGLSEGSKIIMVETTEVCNINQGKGAKQVKSRKFVKQILPTFDTLIMIFKFANSSKEQMIKVLTINFNFLNLPQNFHAKGQGGEG
jgi:hypothetical protein